MCARTERHASEINREREREKEKERERESESESESERERERESCRNGAYINLEQIGEKKWRESCHLFFHLIVIICSATYTRKKKTSIFNSE